MLSLRDVTHKSDISKNLGSKTTVADGLVSQAKENNQAALKTAFKKTAEKAPIPHRSSMDNNLDIEFSWSVSINFDNN